MGQSCSDLPLLDIQAWRGSTEGLLGECPNVEQTHADSVDAGYFRFALSNRSSTPTQVLESLQRFPLARALRGRGGASFPTLTKIDAVLNSSLKTGARVTLVANGAEGEPLSFKDRYLMRYRPYTILDGCLIAAAATGATEIVLYVADAPSRAAMAQAAETLRTAHPDLPAMRIFTAQETYVAGEESAAVRAVNVGVARPTDKPPRPYQSGVGGAPTLVSNVESLAWLAHAALGDRAGTSERFLATVSGDGVAPRLYELPLGITLGDVQDVVVGPSGQPHTALMGGYFGGIIPMERTLAMTYDALRGAGSSLGCGAIYILDPMTCPIKVAADVAAYFAEHNARQCLSCIYSSDTVAATLSQLSSPGVAAADVLEKLTRWGNTLPGTGACAVPDGVAVLLRTLVRHFSEDITRHIESGCSQCQLAASEVPRRPLQLVPSSAPLASTIPEAAR